MPRLRRELRDIERFGASVVIADIGTNDLSPSSLDPMKLAEDIVEYLREISELRGVCARCMCVHDTSECQVDHPVDDDRQ